MNNKEFKTQWTDPIHKIGSITLILASIASILPPLYLYFGYDITLNIKDVIYTWFQLVATFGALYIIEPIAYYSSLGYAGTYLSFLSGNIGNLRVPCAYTALEVTETPYGTKEAEIISTLGISGSIIVNLVIVAFGAIFSSWVLSITPEILISAFRRFITPAVYGAMIGQLGMSLPKLVPIAIFLPLILRVFFPIIPGVVVNVFVIIVNVLCAYFLYYKKGVITNKT